MKTFILKGTLTFQICKDLGMEPDLIMSKYMEFTVKTPFVV